MARAAKPGGGGTRAERIALLVLVTAAALAVWPLRRRGLIPNDEGWLLHPTLRMLEGEVLYRDVWVHYAPLRYHLLEGLFSLTGPSLLAARGLLAVMILLGVAGIFRLALRFAPVWLAWIPAAVYALVPGPWYAAFYALCTVGFFLALARALERPTGARLLVLGGAVGLTLVTRHELGMAQLGLAIASAAWAAARARPDAAPTLAAALRGAGTVIAAAAAPCLAVGAYYASQDALEGLGEALFVRAFGQLEGNSPAHLRRMFAAETFGTAIEGRVAGSVLLTPLVAYPLFAALLLRRGLRDGLERTTVLGAALLLYAVATLPQSFTPPLVVRFLQSAVPFYCIVTWLAASDARAGRSRAADIASAAATAGAGAVLVWLVLAGLSRVDPTDAFTGSLRMRNGDSPVSVGDDVFLTDWNTAEEIRLLRDFVGARTATDEPIFAAPWLSLYYVLLERPNPTSYVFERVSRGDFAMSGAMKAAQMQRLLDSDARYALALARWWLGSPDGDAVRRTLHAHFAPVRDYGSVIVLERTDDAGRLALGGIHARARRRRPTGDDVRTLERMTRELPDEPLPALVLGAMLLDGGDPERATALLERAVRLDPANPTPLEWLATYYLRAGRTDEARAAIERAQAVRDSPGLRALRAQLAAPG